MKTQFRVAPAYCPRETLFHQPVIEADYAGDAAAEYVRQNHISLGDARKFEIQTLQHTQEGFPVIRRFEVVRVPAFQSMREIEVKPESVRIVKTWDELPPEVSAEGDIFSTRVLASKHRDAVMAARALREYIDAIPKEIEFNKAMPGVDRDWIDSVLDLPV